MQQKEGKKVWFLRSGTEQLGPYSKEELGNHPLLTPDTWVWREGFQDWKQVRFVAELEDLFQEEGEEQEKNESTQESISDDVLALNSPIPPPDPSSIWLLYVLVSLLLGVFFLYHLLQ